MMEELENQKPTFESVWAALQETDRLLKENAMKSEMEREKSRANFDREMKESRANFDREMKESQANFDKRIQKLEELIGSSANNIGSFAEEYFFNSFEMGQQNFFGEKFDRIKKNLTQYWQDVEDEYDIVLYNHTSVALIEVKFKAHKNDIPKVIKKSETFRFIYPNYRDFKIYLGLASMCFYPMLEKECVKHGIAIIKQVGGKVIVNDANLKVY